MSERGAVSPADMSAERAFIDRRVEALENMAYMRAIQAVRRYIRAVKSDPSAKEIGLLACDQAELLLAPAGSFGI